MVLLIVDYVMALLKYLFNFIHFFILDINFYLKIISFVEKFNYKFDDHKIHMGHELCQYRSIV